MLGLNLVSQYSNSNAQDWKYFEGMFDCEGCIIDEDRIYCSSGLDIH